MVYSVGTYFKRNANICFLPPVRDLLLKFFTTLLALNVESERGIMLNGIAVHAWNNDHQVNWVEAKGTATELLLTNRKVLESLVIKKQCIHQQSKQWHDSQSYLEHPTDLNFIHVLSPPPSPPLSCVLLLPTFPLLTIFLTHLYKLRLTTPPYLSFQVVPLSYITSLCMIASPLRHT